jgi:hypothetical protein
MDSSWIEDGGKVGHGWEALAGFVGARGRTLPFPEIRGGSLRLDTAPSVRSRVPGIASDQTASGTKKHKAFPVSGMEQAW